MLEPRRNESDEDYRRRIRRHKLLKILVPTGAVLALVGVLAVYAVLTTKLLAKVGERCNPDTECVAHSRCLLDDVGGAGTCVQLCGPTADKCPAGTTCELLDVVENGAATAARTFACLPRTR